MKTHIFIPMKKAHPLFFSLVCLVLFQSPLLAEEIKVGFSQLSNLIEMNENSRIPTGPLADYWEGIAEKMGVSIKWIGPMPSTRLILSLKNHTIDAVAVASKNKKRQEIGIFAAKPIFLEKTVVCLRKEMNIQKIATWSDLESLSKIGTIHGHRLSKYLASKYPQLRLAMIKNKDLVNFSLLKLTNGELDAFIYPGRMGLMEALKKLGLESRIEVIDAPVQPVSYFAFFARPRMDLVEKYNKHHAEVKFRASSIPGNTGSR